MFEGLDILGFETVHVLAVLAAAASALVFAVAYLRLRRARMKQTADDRLQKEALQTALDQASAAIRDLSTYRAALDAYAIIAVTDAKGDITYANDRFCEISGYARHELLRRNHRILNSRHHPKSFFVDMWRTIGKGDFWHGEVCNVSKSGELYWVDTTIIPLIGQDGRPEQFVAVRHDITERKELEERTEFAAMVTACVADIQSAFIEKDWKEAFDIALHKINRLTQSEYGFIGEVLRDEKGAPYLRTYAITNVAWNEATQRFHDENVEKGLVFRNLNTLFGYALTTREPVIANEPATDPRRNGLPHGHPNLNAFMGVPIIVYGELVAMVGLANRPGGYSAELVAAMASVFEVLGQLVMSKRDKDALWESQVALAESEQKFRGLTDIAADWCWQTNADLKFTNVTPGFSKTGLAEDWLLEKRLIDLPNLDTKYAQAEAADAEIEARRDFRDHCIVLSAGPGGARFIRLHAQAQHNDKGVFTGYLGTAEDITEATQQAQMAQQSDRLQSLGTMAAGLAHEFNNILGIVAGHSELARLALERGEQDLSHLEPIAEAARRGARLTKSLLAFGRTQGASPIAAIDVANLLLELKLFLKPLIGPSYKIEMKARGENLAISANKDLLIQAVVNLVLNARDAMPQGGPIRISTRLVTKPGADEPTEVEIGVTDRGPGIPRDMIEKIFDPFFTTKEVGKGTGLGLPLVFRFAKEHGGEVRVRSKLGKGSKFSLTLPRANALANTAGLTTQAGPAMSFAGRTVLVVDDEPALVAAYGQMLRNLGLNVRECATGADALAAIDDEENPIDLLVSDVLMPDIDGPKLANLAKSLNPRLKVLLVTGQPERMGSDKTAGHAAVDILQKPFEMAELREALTTVFSRVDEEAA